MNPKSDESFVLVDRVWDSTNDQAQSSLDSNENNTNDVWTLEFDGSCSFVGFGASIVLISPQGEIFPYSLKLQFANTNNTIEYESLLLGIEVT